MQRTASIPKTLSPEVKKTLRSAITDPMLSMKVLTKNKLFYFIKYFWDTYSEDEFVPNWHIEYICDQLEKVARRVAEKKEKLHDVVINVPPGSTKTAMVSIFFPVWCWVNWYTLRFITTSHSDPLSLESAEYSRDIIRSEKFQAMFPELDVRQDKDTKSNFRVVKKDYVSVGRAPRTKSGGGRVSTSVGSRIIGFHAHIIIVDDLIDPKRAFSEGGLKTANDYMDQTLSTRKTDKKVSVTIMIMQRLHENDPTGHLLAKKDKKVLHICLPGEIKNYEEQLQPKSLKQFYTDNLLDPVRMPWSVMQDMEVDLGQYGFSGQVGQKPTPPEGGMFKVDRLLVINTLPAPISFEETVRYWDKAGTDGSGAYTVGAKMSRLQNNKIIITDIIRGQWSAEKREAIIKDAAWLDSQEFSGQRATPVPYSVYIEQEPGSGGKESAQSTIKNLRGYRVYADRPTGDKVYRADPFSVQVNNGNVLLLKGEWNQKYIDELSNFPFSTYKDQTDASSGAYAKLVNKKIVKVR